jgi:hypothetical protein
MYRHFKRLNYSVNCASGFDIYTEASAPGMHIFSGASRSLFHDKQHPKDMSGAEVESFLTCLVIEQQVAPAIHQQALSALLFLHTKVLSTTLHWL